MVGGGITSAATSAFLSEKLPPGIKVSIWEKARGAGGRMSTSRSSNNPECIADLGAQYVTATPEYEISHKSIYDELLGKKLIKPLSSKIEGMKSKDVKDFVTTKAGMSSLVKYFFEKSGIKPQFNQHVNEISLTEDQKWQIFTQVHQNSLIFRFKT